MVEKVVLEKRSLRELTGVAHDCRRVSDLGYAVLKHSYDPNLIDAISQRAREVMERRHNYMAPRFLGLQHVRGAHVEIPEVAELMNSRERLAALSLIAGVELEPYAIARSACHINYYGAQRTPIDFHTDGAAMVEIIPLVSAGSYETGSTIVYAGPAEEGKYQLQEGYPLSSDALHYIRQQAGLSVLMQGRMLLHSADVLPDADRLTLVLALRSSEEPWKDDTTLMRLLLDDALDQVQEEWITDQVRMAAKYQEMLSRRAQG